MLCPLDHIGLQLFTMLAAQCRKWVLPAQACKHTMYADSVQYHFCVCSLPTATLPTSLQVLSECVYSSRLFIAAYPLCVALQVFNVRGDTANAVDLSQSFPMIKMINWFDQKTAESDINGDLVDWRVSAGCDSSITNTFLGWLNTPAVESNRTYWKTLPHFQTLLSAQYRK